jgi:cation-transporting ATPase E
MTGDGVNDILALKEADCSIAIASGSDAARSVSQLVLLDSNFSSMPSVVAEGRRVVNNIQKSSSLYLMKTIFAIVISIFVIGPLEVGCRNFFKCAYRHETTG